MYPKRLLNTLASTPMQLINSCFCSGGRAAAATSISASELMRGRYYGAGAETRAWSTPGGVSSWQFNQRGLHSTPWEGQ